MNQLPHPSRLLGPLVLLAALVACDRGPSEPLATAPSDAATRLVRAGADSIPGRYVVVFREGQVSDAALAAGGMVRAEHGKMHVAYEHALKGFAAELSPAGVQAMLADPRVAYVAQDAWMELADTQSPATWGLDRIDQRDRPVDNTYTYGYTGEGVTAYVIDSGILTAHTEFGGRATVGTDFVGDGQNGQDCNGHGTHVAGTLGGTTYGVAKEVSLVSVRVFNCAGSSIPSSTTIAAVDWVTANAVKPAVVNMSLSGPTYEPLVQAVQSSIATGLVYAVAAGNQSTDACSRSPASAPGALTVAASDPVDGRAVFSNFGSCVDLFAPGVNITSAAITSNTATRLGSGTSMATPHVAGVAAMYLEGNPTATPAAVASAILTSASYNRVTDAQGSPNRLLYAPLIAEPLVVTPGALSFLVESPAAAASAAAAGSGQPFTASGAGTVRRGGAGSAPAAVAVESGTTGTVLVMNNSDVSVAWSAADTSDWVSMSPTSGIVEAGGVDTIEVAVDGNAVPGGIHHTTLSVAAGPLRQFVEVTVTRMVALQSGVPVTSLSGAPRSQRYFVIPVPAGADSLRVDVSGGSGDADLYVRRGALPTFTAWDCRPFIGGNNERCVAVAPAAGDYYVMLNGFDAYSGVTLAATVFGTPPPPPPPPAAPANVAATGAGPLRVNVTWADSSANETFFRVRRSTRNPDGAFAPYQTVGQRGANNTTLLDSTVVLGATYRYQVQACNEAGCTGSAPSPPITIVQPPAAPTGLGGTVVPGGQVDLAWTDASGNETQFRVRRSTRNPDGTFPAYAVIRTLPGGTTAYSDTSAVPGSVYRYQVQACNGAGCGTSAAVVVTLPPLPAAPTGVSAAAVSASQVNLGWTDGSTNESQFRVRRTIRNPDGSYAPYQTIATLGAGVTSYQDLTVTAGATHRYIVQACNASGCGNSVSVGVTVPGS
jgi:serine protease